MRSRFVLLFLALMSASVLARQEGKFEVALGTGADIARFGPLFKNNRSFSASIFYNLTDESGVVLYLGQQQYGLDRLSSDHQGFVGGKPPQAGKTVTSLLAGGRFFIQSKLKFLNPYVSVAFGYAKSVSSGEGYYVVSHMTNDTAFHRIPSGHFFLGHLAPGIQVRPVSFVDLYAELQIVMASDVDLSPGPIAGRIGIGVIF
jgi:hypothetical protein